MHSSEQRNKKPKTWRTALVALALGLTLATGAAPVVAQSASSAEEAAAYVRGDTGGRIIGVERRGDRFIVKVLKNGKVRVVAVRAR